MQKKRFECGVERIKATLSLESHNPSGSRQHIVVSSKFCLDGSSFSMFEVEGPFENLNFTNNKSEEKAVVFFQFVIPRDVNWNSIGILFELFVQILFWNSFTETILFYSNFLRDTKTIYEVPQTSSLEKRFSQSR